MQESNKSQLLNSVGAAGFIFTQDLTYTHPEGKYSFRFSYLGEGVFIIKSFGYIDEKSFRIQLQYGDKARERLKEIHPQIKYHLIWDVSSVTGLSLISRSMMFSKVTTIGIIASVSIIGASSFAKNFSKIFSKLIPWVKFFYFTSQEEAIENLDSIFKKRLTKKNSIILSSDKSDINANFMDLWQENTEYMLVAEHKLKMVQNNKWCYTSPDNNYSVKFSVIEGNILYIECEGFAKTIHIEQTYSILESIVTELQYNPTFNKYYSVLNIRKLKGISLSARKLTAEYEKVYHDKIHLVIMVPSPILKMLFKIVQLLKNEYFSHWKINSSLEAAFESVLNHRLGQFESFSGMVKEAPKKDAKIIPEEPNVMRELIRKQQQEIDQLKINQQEQIDNILEIMGRMTWDESFSEDLIIPHQSGPFSDIYASLHVLFQDFQEIIREKTQHARQLKESDDKYRNFINLATDVIAIYQGTTIKFVNYRIKQILDYAPEELIGKSMDGFVIPEEQARLEEYHKKRLNGEEVPWFYETVFIHRDGRQVPISMSVGTIEFENQPAVMLIARDVTQKKKTDEELERYRNHLEDIIKERTQQLQKEISERKIAEESDRLKTAFLSNMSHEIRTPMNAIISFSNFLRKPDIKQEEHEEYLNYIQSSGETLLTLINDIIDISKIEAHQLQIQESLCSIDPILDELYIYFNRHLKHLAKTEVKLVLEIPDQSRNINLVTDAYRLKQILTNLIDNAIKFTDLGCIEFGYKLENEMIVFFVKDSGVGIPSNKLNLIFKRFGKIELSDRNLSGTGLGLAISHNLAALLHGSLRVESVEGKGSSFYLELPHRQIHQQQLNDKLMETSYRDNYNWQDKNILIVEDEDLNYRVLQISLRSTKAKITRAVNGKEAVENVNATNKIDIILMDIQMPIMDGYEALSIIKKAHPNLPIIAQTAFAMMEEKKHCIDMGFDDYISKPIKFEELFAKVDRLIEKKEH